MHFIIQTVDGKVVHDFNFTLLESIRYLNWFYQKDGVPDGYTYEFCDKLVADYVEDAVPSGTVEFVENYIGEHHELHIKPRNIPLTLMGQEFTCRHVFNGGWEDIQGLKFVKSNDRIKLYTEVVTSNADVPIGNYQISDIIDIHSEWRSFVYKQALVGLQNYSGDFTIFPNVGAILKMIEAFEGEAPIAYTLDVGVNKSNTFVIEVHDFFSCGLYGFAQHRHYPYMLYKWYHEFINGKI